MIEMKHEMAAFDAARRVRWFAISVSAVLVGMGIAVGSGLWVEGLVLIAVGRSLWWRVR
jgi:hypothetical protein